MHASTDEAIAPMPHYIQAAMRQDNFDLDRLAQVRSMEHNRSDLSTPAAAGMYLMHTGLKDTE